MVLWKSLAVSYKVKYVLTISNNYIPGYLPQKGKEMKTYAHITQTFTTALITAKNGKQSKCVPVGEWINCSSSIQWNITL